MSVPFLEIVFSNTYHPVDEGDYEGKGKYKKHEEQQVPGDIETLKIVNKHKI